MKIAKLSFVSYALLAVLFWLLYAFDTHNVLWVAIVFSVCTVISGAVISWLWPAPHYDL